jgi:hypothetical protein
MAVRLISKTRKILLFDIKCLVQFQGPNSVPFFYLCGHGFNSEENRQALV